MTRPRIILTAFILILLLIIFGGKIRHRQQAKQVDTGFNPKDTLYWLQGGEIPVMDNSDQRIWLSIRRASTIINTEKLDQQYWQYAAFYYKTHNEKWRLKANKFNEEYKKSFELYKRQDDSLNSWIELDTSK